MDAYQMLFKRKSFHVFGVTDSIAPEELSALESFIKNAVPLDPSVKTAYRIIRERGEDSRRGAEYRIELFTEQSGNGLFHVGYVGEQIDLWCAAHDIGALWCGLGKPKDKELDGLPFVIMILIAKMPADKFRKDVFKAKRKSVEEIWQGETFGAAEIARFAPSACNSQPWFVEADADTLTVFRAAPAKHGIMPKAAAGFYNRIDIGIFLYVLEVCLKHEGIAFERIALAETETQGTDRTRVAEYALKKA